MEIDIDGAKSVLVFWAVVVVVILIGFWNFIFLVGLFCGLMVLGVIFFLSVILYEETVAGKKYRSERR